MAETELKNSGIVNVCFGEDVCVVQPVNLYGCTIGDNVFFGPFVEIQKNVQNGFDVKFNPIHLFASLSRSGKIVLSHTV